MQGLRLSELQSEIHYCIRADIMLMPSFDTQQNEEFVVLNIRFPSRYDVQCSRDNFTLVPD